MNQEPQNLAAIAAAYDHESLPRARTSDGTGGELKAEIEDFEVEEIPAYEPSGEGEHVFLWVEKRDTPSEEMVRKLAQALSVRPADIGVAGMKDRRAVTRQFVSVPVKCEGDLPQLDIEGVRVLSHARHRNKLKTGHLRGNRFTILLRNVPGVSNAHALTAATGQRGFPNYFGDQRFGYGNETLATGLQLLCGEKKPGDLRRSRRKFLLRFALSAAQSFLFNQVLARRLSAGKLFETLPGDVMHVVESGGKFVTTDVAVDHARFMAGEIVPTGPLTGPKMKRPEGAVAEEEAAVLAQYGLTEEAFRLYPQLTAGARRPLLIRPADIAVESPAADQLLLRFVLPPGVYATTLLREIM